METRRVTDSGTGLVQIDGVKGDAYWEFKGDVLVHRDGRGNTIDGTFQTVQWTIKFGYADAGRQKDAVNALLKKLKKIEPDFTVAMQIDNKDGGMVIPQFLGKRHERLFLVAVSVDVDAEPINEFVVSNAIDIL